MSWYLVKHRTTLILYPGINFRSKATNAREEKNSREEHGHINLRNSMLTTGNPTNKCTIAFRLTPTKFCKQIKVNYVEHAPTHPHRSCGQVQEQTQAQQKTEDNWCVNSKSFVALSNPVNSAPRVFDYFTTLTPFHLSCSHFILFNFGALTKGTYHLHQNWKRISRNFVCVWFVV
jgi:hypothetical protein